MVISLLRMLIIYLLKLSGLISCLIFLTFFFVLLKIKKVNINTQQVSNLSRYPGTGLIFRLVLGFCFLLQFIFAGQIIAFFNLWPSLAALMLIMSTVSGLLASIFTAPKHLLLHSSLIATMMLAGCLGIILLGLNLFNRIPIVAYANLAVVFSIGIFLIPAWFKKRTLSAKDEFVFVGLTLIWTCFNTVILFVR